MYNNLASQTVAQDQIVVLPNLNGRLTNLNDEQGGLLNQIEDKLHNILFKKTPEQKMEATPPEQINDFNSSMEMQLRRIGNSNRRLEKILNHLNEII